MDRDRTRMTLRLVAGMYVLYLAYQIYRTIGVEDGLDPKWAWLMIVVFIVCGGLFAFSGIRGLMNQAVQTAEDEEESKEESVEDAEDETETVEAITESEAVDDTAQETEA